MTLLLVVGAAVLVVIAAGVMTVWARRRRARRDLEGDFQKEWVDRERWASLADSDQPRPHTARPKPEPIRTDQ